MFYTSFCNMLYSVHYRPNYTILHTRLCAIIQTMLSTLGYTALVVQYFVHQPEDHTHINSNATGVLYTYSDKRDSRGSHNTLGYNNNNGAFK